MGPPAAGTTPTQFLIALLSLAAVALIGLSALIGALAVALHAVEASKVTVRVWLGLSCLATLVVPVVAWGAVTIGDATYNAMTRTPATPLGAAQLAIAQVVVPLAAFLVVLAGVVWLTGQTVLRPLAALRQAARGIAAGDLAIHLPEAHVRELAELADAFGAMGEALRDAITRQARLEQQRRLVIGAIAHDLRTPLFALRGLLEGLEIGLADTPAKTARYLAISRQQADNLERLVEDLFSFARLEYLDEAPRAEPLDLAALLVAVVEAARPRAAAKDIALAAAGPERCPARGDPHLLTRAVENLLDNALRHTPEGGRVAVSWERAGTGWRFHVSDTGPGIAPGELPYIFDPLFRGEVSRNRATGGAGLGLAIARRILRAHGGDLTAVNREDGAGTGAVFTGTLPRGDAADSVTEMVRGDMARSERQAKELGGDEPHAEGTEGGTGEPLGALAQLASRAGADPLAREAEEQRLAGDQEHGGYDREAQHAEGEADRQFIQTDAEGEDYHTPATPGRGRRDPRGLAGPLVVIANPRLAPEPDPHADE